MRHKPPARPAMNSHLPWVFTLPISSLIFEATETQWSGNTAHSALKLKFGEDDAVDDATDGVYGELLVMQSEKNI